MLQAANAEVGTRQPIREVAADLAPMGIPLLVDALACVGRDAIPAGWSVLAAQAVTWGGPPGLGLLVIRTGVRWRTPSPLEDREAGRVPGFSAVPLAVAAAAALEAVERDRLAESQRLQDLTERLRAQLVQRVSGVEVLGHPDDRLPYVAAFSFLYVDGETLLDELDRLGLAVGSGSACTSDTQRPSHVLAAMGRLSQGNIRVSLPPGCPTDTVDRLAGALPDVVADIRRRWGAADL